MVKKQLIVLKGGSIHAEQGILKNSAIIIEDKKIAAILPQNEVKNVSTAKKYDFPEDFHIIPGFIDMHIHGSNGCDVMDASSHALATISQSLKKQGTTSFLATTMTASPEKIENVLCHVRDYILHQQDVDGATILGVHLEGPFLSPNKVGAQRKDLILNPDIKLIERWQKISNNVIKLITIAPELPNSLECIRYLKQKNILASIGHTDATYAETMAAIEAGSSHVTHLFNAMRGIHQREPGTVTAALLSDQVTAELIVDGIHLHPAIVDLAFKLKHKDKIVLVTDAMRAQCLKEGTYDLGGQSVNVKNNMATLADGTLAGSTLKMSDAFTNMLSTTQCTMSDMIKMTAENPAKSLGIFDRKGSIALKKDADLVVLDKNFKIILTLC